MPMTLSDITLILSVLAFLTAVYCLWQTMSLNRLRKSFFAGSQAVNLESVILALDMGLKNSQEQQMVLEQTLKQLKDDSTFATQKVGLVRFNPFDDGGGNFSFCLALLDAHNNGVVVTSMHGRQQNRIYSKRILNGHSDAQLTEEEIEAITQANSKSENLNSKQKFKS
jgi:hypothetical protein